MASWRGCERAAALAARARGFYLSGMSSCAHEHHRHEPSETALVAALQDAEARCEAAGERFTAPRRRVLEQLLSAGGPVKAYDLIASYAVDGSPVGPPTVYRALEFLEARGLVHRLESLNAFVACRHGPDRHGAAFLICDCCGAAQEIDPPAQQLGQLGAAQGFQVAAVTLEAHGLCANCRKA